MSALCPNCRQTLAKIGDACAEIGCKRRGYHGVPADCVSDKLDARVGLLLANKYLLIRLLGRGGMGVVMVALQQPLMREVALKVISGVAVDDTMRGRFEREARAVAALDHPNVVKLVDFGVAHLDEEAPYMVMELVSGATSMRQVLAGWRESPPTWKGVAEVFSQLLAGLDAAHERGIVHRDVKPDNVMCKKAKGYDWFVKVLDFGLAKTFDPGAAGKAEMPSLTDAGAIVGTPQYMAPEQLSRVHFGPMDERVDLYAVGVMLFELLMGRRPYSETDPMTLVFAKLDPDRDPLLDCRELDRFGPMGVVVRRASAWAAADRYASADEFRAALADAVAELGPNTRVVLAQAERDLTGSDDSGAKTIAAADTIARPKGRPSGPLPVATPAPQGRGFSDTYTDLAVPSPLAQAVVTTPSVPEPAVVAQPTRPRWLIPAAVGALLAVAAVWLATRKMEPAPVVAVPAAATAPAAAAAAATPVAPATAPATAAPPPAAAAATPVAPAAAPATPAPAQAQPAAAAVPAAQPAAAPAARAPAAGPADRAEAAPHARPSAGAGAKVKKPKADGGFGKF